MFIVGVIAMDLNVNANTEPRQTHLTVISLIMLKVQKSWTILNRLKKLQIKRSSFDEQSQYKVDTIVTRTKSFVNKIIFSAVSPRPVCNPVTSNCV
jgi:hypothetical protein